MAYDRGRTVHNPHDSMSFGSSGSPRSRYPSDASGTMHRAAPCRPHVSTSNASTIAEKLPNAKDFMELMSQRVYWYIQRDNAEKRSAKLGKDVDRCKAGDFPSSANLLDVQAKAVELEKAKISHRMAALDDKIVETTTSLWSTLEAVAQARSYPGNQPHDLTPPPSETSSDINLSIDEKMAQMRDSLEASIRNQLTEQSQKIQTEIKDAYEARTAAIQDHYHQESQKLTQMRTNLEKSFNTKVSEESQKLQSKLKVKYEEQIAALNQDLSQEKEFSKTLQVELKSLSARLENKIEDQAKVSSQLDQAVKQEAFVDLESRVAKFEASQPVARSGRRHAAKDRKVGAKDPATAQDFCLQFEKELQDMMKQFLLQNREMIVTDERVLKIVEPEFVSLESKLQQTLTRSSSGFGILLDRERKEQASLREQLMANAQSATQSAVQSVAAAIQSFEAAKAELKADMTDMKTASDTTCQSTMSTIKSLEAQLENLGTLLSSTTKKQEALSENLDTLMSSTFRNQEVQLESLTTLLSSTKSANETAQGTLQKSVDALWLRLKNIDAWQQNFSTPLLFDAIVQYLNRHFMAQHASTLMTLRDRMAKVESQFAEGSNKKRKTADHGPLPSPSMGGR